MKIWLLIRDRRKGDSQVLGAFATRELAIAAGDAYSAEQCPAMVGGETDDGGYHWSDGGWEQSIGVEDHEVWQGANGVLHFTVSR